MCSVSAKRDPVGGYLPSKGYQSACSIIPNDHATLLLDKVTRPRHILTSLLLSDDIVEGATRNCEIEQTRGEQSLPLPICTMWFHEQRNAQESALADQTSLVYNDSTTSEENVMANQEHLDLLQHSIDNWNTWRKEHRDIQPDFSEADLILGAELHEADLRDVESH